MSSYSPERCQVSFARDARPFKLALLEQSLALFEIVRPRGSAALEGQPCAEPDQDDSGQPRHHLADPRPEAAATKTADYVAVGDEPGQERGLDCGHPRHQP